MSPLCAAAPNIPTAPTGVPGRGKSPTYHIPSGMKRLAPLLFLLTAVLSACGPAARVTTVPVEAPAQPPVVVAQQQPDVPGVPAPDDLFAGVTFDPDTVTFSRFDAGRMWTFDNPPTEYLRQTYAFAPDAAWYRRAQLGTLRFAAHCSASFVSPQGLILTNHHCARENITAVTREGEDLHAAAFYAATTGEERAVEDLYVEQLIDIRDVTAEVLAAGTGRQTAAERIMARNERIEALETRMTTERGGEAAGIRVQVVEFYSGGQYSAYVYRRFDDIRLVLAPERTVGYFGGDPDNFTFPRYTLDFTLFRAYGPDGRPLDTSTHYFPWSTDGTSEGDLVFVIGNPGSTARLQTVAELLFRRDVSEPAILRLIATRADAYQAFIEANPDHPDIEELRDTYFSLSNARKAYTGHVAGLRDQYIIARRMAAERALRDAIQANPELRPTAGGAIDAIARNRVEARAAADDVGAFLGMSPTSSTASVVLGRAVFAYGFGLTGSPGLRTTALAVEEDRPEALEVELIRLKLDDLVLYFGEDDPVVLQVLQGRTPAAAARAIYDGTQLRTHAGTQQLIQAGNITRSADPAIAFARAIFPRFANYQQRIGALDAQRDELRADLDRARFALYGTDVPPDATFTLRINDGVVQGYPYNGTVAPPYTTFWGMYDRHFSHAGTALEEFFELPQRWFPAPAGLDLSTPYNFVTTNDITGGNSGSPMLNRNLEIVGVAFDGNIESLPGDFIYLPEVNRAIGVDSRAMIHTLESVYNAQRLAEELRQGRLVRTN
jgi:hypothetical protein